VLDHFLLYEALFNTYVSSVYALHGIDNTSDHEPIVLQLCLQIKFIQYSDQMHTPQIAWVEASTEVSDHYRISDSARISKLFADKINRSIRVCPTVSEIYSALQLK